MAFTIFNRTDRKSSGDAHIDDMELAVLLIMRFWRELAVILAVVWVLEKLGLAR